MVLNHVPHDIVIVLQILTYLSFITYEDMILLPPLLQMINQFNDSPGFSTPVDRNNCIQTQAFWSYDCALSNYAIEEINTKGT